MELTRQLEVVSQVSKAVLEGPEKEFILVIQ